MSQLIINPRACTGGYYSWSVYVCVQCVSVPDFSRMANAFDAKLAKNNKNRLGQQIPSLFLPAESPPQ